MVVIIGYSFGDKHMNDVLLQRMKENLELKLLIAQPSAKEAAFRLLELQENPRVHFIEKSAKAALNDGSILDQTKELLDQIVEEKPF